MFDKILFLSVKLFGSVKKWPIERFQEYIALVMTQPRDHVMHLYASAVLIHARYVVIIMPAYTRHNEVLHGQSRSPLSSSLMTFHVHIIYVFPSFFYTSFVRTTYFRKKKKKIFLGIQSTRNRYSKYTFNPYIAYTRFFRSINYYSCHLNYDHFINYHRFQTDHRQRDLKYLWASKTRSNTRDRKIVQHWIIRNENF